MWGYENFTILVAISLIPFMWGSSIFPLFSWYWQLVYEWSAVKAAVHLWVRFIYLFPLGAYVRSVS